MSSSLSDSICSIFVVILFSIVHFALFICAIINQQYKKWMAQVLAFKRAGTADSKLTIVKGQDQQISCNGDG
jgi:hypothetical protein